MAARQKLCNLRALVGRALVICCTPVGNINNMRGLLQKPSYSERLQIMLQTRCQRHRALLATLCFWQPGPRDPAACAGLLRREPLAACVRAFVPPITKVRRQRGAGRTRAGGRAAPAFWRHLAAIVLALKPCSQAHLQISCQASWQRLAGAPLLATFSDTRYMMF